MVFFRTLHKIIRTFYRVINWKVFGLIEFLTRILFGKFFRVIRIFNEVGIFDEVMKIFHEVI